MNLLVIGSGAREHTIAWKISQSREVAAQILEHGNATAAAIASIATKRSF